MITTIHPEIKKEADNHGLYQVYIRITRNRRHKRIKTQVSLESLDDWNQNTRNGRYIRISAKDSKAKNIQLEKELESVKRYIQRNDDPFLTYYSFNPDEEILMQRFMEYARRITESKNRQESSKGRAYRIFSRKFQVYLRSIGKEDIPFKELTPAIVTDFENWLRVQPKERCSGTAHSLITPNYVKSIMITFRALIRRAIMIEGLLDQSKDPFRNYTIKEEKVIKEKLEKEELLSIISLDLEKGSWLWHTRNCFLFSFYCAGIRSSDLLQMRWCNIRDGRLLYQMSKSRKIKDMRLVPQAIEILDLYRTDNSKATDYIFPLLDSNAEWAGYINPQQKETMPAEIKNRLFIQTSSKNVLLNRNLKKIGRMAGISKNLTFHMSRHTFAYQAMKNGIDHMIIKEALAHSSLSTTEKYLGQFNTEEVDSALEKLFTKEFPEPAQNPQECLYQ